MRDVVAIEIGDQTVASSPAGAAVSRGANEPNRRNDWEGSMFGALAGRKRRALWAILSFLFVLGVAVSTTMLNSERDAALDSVVERARTETQLVTAALTGKQLTKPVTGSSYDDLATKIWRSISSKGSIVGVTVWSSHGRILFSLNESRVGRTPQEMRPLITSVAGGTGSVRVLDDTVQTFTPASKATDGPVAIVEIDQPLAIVDAQIGDLWSTLRLGSGVGLVISLLLLGLTFVSPKERVRAPEDDERSWLDERQDGGEGADVKPERQPPAEQPTGKRQPTYDEIFGLQPHHDEATVRDDAVEGDLEPEESTQEPREEFADMAVEGDLEPRESTQEPREEFADMAVEGDLEPRESMQEPGEEFQDTALDGDLQEQESMQEQREEFQDTALDGDRQTEESIRQRREEFKARAKQAELRLKKVEAELHEASSAANSER
jgi:hypothetical protein